LNDTIQFQTFDYFDVADAITSEGGTVFGDLTITGTITGDGTGLTGVASTDYIITGTAATFTGGINAAQSDVSVRNLTGVAATFTGVLTYEDVTNVDSVGLITARSGIDVTGASEFNDHVEFKGTSGSSSIYMYDENAINLGTQNDATIIYNNTGNIVKFERSGSAGEIEIDAAPVTIQHSNSTKLETTSSGVVVTGIVTATSFVGNGEGLTNLNIPAAFNELDSALFN